ncbi:MAG: polysaccharide lyase [Thiolinea sp.]
MKFRALLIAAALSYTPLVSGGNSPLPANELKITFNNHQPALYEQKQLSQDWHNIMWNGTRNRARILRDPKNSGNNVLRVKYPANVVGPWHSGSQFFAHLPAANEYWLTYKVRFQPGFDFKKGGKLPGLGSGDGRYAGGRKPYNGDGWTSRLMWLEDGRIVPYLYYVGMPKSSRFGHHWPVDARIKRGQWQEITQRVRVNSPGQRNGLYEIWLDGRLVTRRSDMVWRYGNKAPVNAFFFSTFHGGAGLDWAPRWDSYIDFDDISISRHMPDRVRRAYMAMR